MGESIKISAVKIFVVIEPHSFELLLFTKKVLGKIDLERTMNESLVWCQRVNFVVWYPIVPRYQNHRSVLPISMISHIFCGENTPNKSWSIWAISGI